MRSFLILLSISFVFLLLISACGGNNDSSNFSDSAVALGEEFIEKLYTIDDESLLEFDEGNVESLLNYQNNFSSYFTESEFKDLSVNRFFLMPQELAFKQDLTTSVQNIEFEKYNRDESENDSLDFKFSFTLKFTDNEGNEIDKLEMTGQMTVVKIQDMEKIDRYHDSKIPMDRLNS